MYFSWKGIANISDTQVLFLYEPLLSYAYVNALKVKWRTDILALFALIANIFKNW